MPHIGGRTAHGKWGHCRDQFWLWYLKHPEISFFSLREHIMVYRSCDRFWSLPLYCGTALAIPSPRVSSPVVILDEGTFTGVTDGTTDKFLGIPFALPP